MADNDPNQGPPPEPPPEEGPPPPPEEGPPPEQQQKQTLGQLENDGGAEMRVQVKKTGLQNFATFLYDKETGAVLGRTGRRWLKILIFYLIFYTAIFAFFFLYLFIIYQLLPLDQPRLIGNASLLKGSPGLSFRPENDNNDSSLIWFKVSNMTDVDFYSNQLEKIINLETDVRFISKRRINATKIDCRKDNGKRKPKGKEVCEIYMNNKGEDDSKRWGRCTAFHKFGYKYGTPCVLIRLNQIINWTPKHEFETAQTKSKHFKATTGKNFEDIKGHVLIECSGETQLDDELMGDISVYPDYPGMRGVMSLPPNYFPYRKGKGYLPPFVMLQFTAPTRGALIRVRCFAYNKNVKIDKRDGLGTVMIELLVDR